MEEHSELSYPIQDYQIPVSRDDFGADIEEGVTDRLDDGNDCKVWEDETVCLGSRDRIGNLKLEEVSEYLNDAYKEGNSFRNIHVDYVSTNLGGANGKSDRRVVYNIVLM